MLSSALAAPLVRLNSVVERIARRARARVEVASSDELGQVSIAFNQMAQSIQDSLAKELAATNLLAPRSIRCWGGQQGRRRRPDRQDHGAGEDAIGRWRGLERMFDNLRSLLNDVQKAGIQVTTSATEIAASAKQQEATGVEQAQTSIEILSTTKEISANITELVGPWRKPPRWPTTPPTPPPMPRTTSNAWTAPCRTWSPPPTRSTPSWRPCRKKLATSTAF
jgi:methyl-accepting chemotaxis protein WspA